MNRPEPVWHALLWKGAVLYRKDKMGIHPMFEIV
jgi:hypothetical protein